MLAPCPNEIVVTHFCVLSDQIYALISQSWVGYQGEKRKMTLNYATSHWVHGESPRHEEKNTSV